MDLLTFNVLLEKYEFDGWTGEKGVREIFPGFSLLWSKRFLRIYTFHAILRLFCLYKKEKKKKYKEKKIIETKIVDMVKRNYFSYVTLDL
jgi:hypothetical protein